MRRSLGIVFVVGHQVVWKTQDKKRERWGEKNEHENDKRVSETGAPGSVPTVCDCECSQPALLHSDHLVPILQRQIGFRCLGLLFQKFRHRSRFRCALHDQHDPWTRHDFRVSRTRQLHPPQWSLAYASCACRPSQQECHSIISQESSSCACGC